MSTTPRFIAKHVLMFLDESTNKRGNKMYESCKISNCTYIKNGKESKEFLVTIRSITGKEKSFVVGMIIDNREKKYIDPNEGRAYIG